MTEQQSRQLRAATLDLQSKIALQCREPTQFNKEAVARAREKVRIMNLAFGPSQKFSSA